MSRWFCGLGLERHQKKTLNKERELLTQRELADKLRISESSIHRGQKRGEITPIRFGSRVVRYRFEEVVEQLRVAEQQRQLRQLKKKKSNTQ